MAGALGDTEHGHAGAEDKHWFASVKINDPTSDHEALADRRLQWLLTAQADHPQPAHLRSIFVPNEPTAEGQVLAMNLPLYVSRENGGSIPRSSGPFRPKAGRLLPPNCTSVSALSRHAAFGISR